jgi:hypothetical protein
MLRANTQYAKLEQNGSDSYLNLNNYKGFSSMNLAWKLVSFITLCEYVIEITSRHNYYCCCMVQCSAVFCWICNVVRKLWLLFDLSQRRQSIYSTEPQNYYRSASVRIKTVISGKTGHRTAKSNRVLLQLGISIKNY